MTRRIDVNLEELGHVLEEAGQAGQAPLSDADYDKLEKALVQNSTLGGNRLDLKRA